MAKFLIPVFFLFMIFSCSTANRLIKIMPIGDSITAGEHYGFPSLGERTGYRKTLYEMLAKKGYHIDFVGSQRHGIRSKNSKDWYDWNCEAYPGWKIPEIADKVKIALTVYQPNMLLIHVGTNGNDWNNKPRQLREMLDMINDYSVGNNFPMTVFLCLIINRFKGEDATPTTNFNVEVVNMVESRIDDKITIVLVDMENEAGIDYSDEMPEPNTNPPYEGGDMWGNRFQGVPHDKYHPNDKGNAKMAVKFYNAIVDVLSKQ